MPRRPALPIAPFLATLGLLATGLGTATPAAAQGVGYVDMERVLQESALGKAAQTRLEERFGTRQQPFAEEEAAIRKLQATLERDRPLMSKAQVGKAEQEIKDRITKFEADFAEIQKEIVQAQQEEGRKLLPAAREAVQSVAKQKKLTVVFEANATGVMYLDEGGDITAAVISAINAKAK